MAAADEVLVHLVADGVKPAEQHREPGPRERAHEEGAEDRVLGQVRELAQHEIPASEAGGEARDRGEGEDHGAQMTTGAQARKRVDGIAR